MTIVWVILVLLIGHFARSSAIAILILAYIVHRIPTKDGENQWDMRKEYIKRQPPKPLKRLVKVSKKR